MVEYNRRKKEELKQLNEQITKRDGIEHKPIPNMNNYVYVSSLSLFGLAIGSYLLYSKFNPIPHREGGGADSALIQVVFFITSVTDAAEPRNLVTFPKI